MSRSEVCGGQGTETMQHHYSTANGNEQREALAKVIRLFANEARASSGEDGGEGGSQVGRINEKPARRRPNRLL